MPVTSKPQAESTSTSRPPARTRASLRSWKPTAGGKQRRLAGRLERLLRIREGNDLPRAGCAGRPQSGRVGTTDHRLPLLGAVCCGVSGKPIFRCSRIWGAASRRWPRHWRPPETALRKNQGRQGHRTRLLPLVTEAQSALRAALKRLGAAEDSDQLEVFEWVKATAARQHVYLKRFMRADDAADPSGWSELLLRASKHFGGRPAQPAAGCRARADQGSARAHRGRGSRCARNGKRSCKL